MVKYFWLAGLLGLACSSANAGVLVNLDGQDVNDVSSIRYDPGGGLFEVTLSDNLSCRAGNSGGSLIDIELGIGGQVFALSGPITMNFSTEPVTVTINSLLGNADCSDRIFNDALKAS